MKVGDTIQCKDIRDMSDVMYALNRKGIKVDFMFEKDGVKGFWLVITEVRSQSLTT